MGRSTVEIHLQNTCTSPRQFGEELTETQDHRLEETLHGTSSYLVSGTLMFRFIVNHCTAGWSGPGARNWLMGKDGGASNTKMSTILLSISIDPLGSLLTGAEVTIERKAGCWT